MSNGIAVTAKIFPLNFLMLLFKPVVEIDGTAHAASWSRTELPAAPGQHSVTISWKYLWVMPANKATITVDVAEGSVVEVSYKARWMVFLPGKVAVVATPAPVAAAA